jgi:uncharacterized protein YeaO (DUF488 family)
MPIRTKRWDEKRSRSDGFRVLICRYRPRALAKDKETWDQWLRCLGPSVGLHAAIYGKAKDGEGKPLKVVPLPWAEYAKMYVAEMAADEQAQEAIAFLAELVAEGKTVTLLCSRSCTDENRCHRTLLKGLIEAEVAKLTPGEPGASATGGAASGR